MPDQDRMRFRRLRARRQLGRDMLKFTGLNSYPLSWSFGSGNLNLFRASAPLLRLSVGASGTNERALDGRPPNLVRVVLVDQ